MPIVDMDQTTIIGTKPYRSVTGAIRCHHNIGGKATTRLIVDFRLARLGIILNNTSVIGTQPVVALRIHCRGIDIAQLQRLETDHLLYILVNTVTIGGNPHAAVLVEHQMLGRILTERGGVELIVHELFHFLAFRINHKQALMVGRHPYPPTIIHTDIPHLKGIRQ